MRVLNRKLFVSLFAFFAFASILLFFTFSCYQYKGDGQFINRWFSFSNRYHVFFDRFPVTENMSIRKYSFSGIPNDYFSLYFSLNLECKADYCYSISNSEMRKKTKNLIKDMGIKIGVEIIEDGMNIMSLERSLLSSENRKISNWRDYNLSYFPYSVRYERVELGLLGGNKTLIMSSDSMYEIYVSVEADRTLPVDLYIQPIMEGGAAWPL